MSLELPKPQTERNWGWADRLGIFPLVLRGWPRHLPENGSRLLLLMLLATARAASTQDFPGGWARHGASWRELQGPTESRQQGWTPRVGTPRSSWAQA